MIPRSFIQQLVQRCDIEEIVSGYVLVKRAGRNLKALCPFHSEKTPSLVLYPDNQSFYCFGCGAGGDVISFIMRAENLDYPDAVRFLARRVGMEVPEEGDDSGAQLRARVLQLNREAALFFHKCLKTPAGREGYAYLHEKRGLPDKIITSYGLGYAPDSWNALGDYLLGKGFTQEELLAAALSAKGRKGGIYDQFRNRVMFPILDLRGNVIGFGGRVLDDSKPKYLNSPDTPVFKKSRNLFSLNFAKNAGKEQLILAEGYMDVIAIYAAGFRNVVATLGTALTGEQARLMSKYAREILIAYDSDGAGQAATHRAINLLSEAGLTAKVIHMEGAKDPDEYIKKFGPTRFQLLLEGASDVIAHELAGIRARCDLETSEGRIEYLKGAVNVLADIRSPLEREVYASDVAQAAGVTAEAVGGQVNALIRKRAKEREKKEWRDIELNKEASQDRINPQKRQNLKEAQAEEGILAFLMDHPDSYGYLLNRIRPEDFVTDFNRKVLEAMASLRREGEVSLSLLGQLLTPEELRGAAGILARHHDQTQTKELLDAYIDILLAHKDRLKPEAARAADPADIEAYRRRLRERK